jgi:ligand-binding SRPBCC domain-containing protein
MTTYTLTTEQTLRAPIDRTFTFFSNAANLEAITPPFLNFRILTVQPIQMRPGTLIDYSLKLHGLRLKWQSKITLWEPPTAGADGRKRAKFIDEQVRGPYALWIHQHTFEELVDDSGCLCTIVRDLVTYRVPGGPLGAPIHRWFVRPRLEQIFKFREDATKRLIEGSGE